MKSHNHVTLCLDRRLVGNRGDGLGEVVLGGHDPGVPGADGLSLQMDVDALLLGLDLLRGVRLDTVQELLARPGVDNVLDADVDALLHVALADALVDDDADSGLGHVVDDTGLAVEELEGHTVVTTTFSFQSFQSVCMVFCNGSLQTGGVAPGNAVSSTDPLWIAPLTLMSTISPTLYHHD